MPSAGSECYEDRNGPVFIGGMERSGTSMLRAVVGSHPDIAFYEWDHKFWFHNFPARAHEWQKSAQSAANEKNAPRYIFIQ